MWLILDSICLTTAGYCSFILFEPHSLANLVKFTVAQVKSLKHRGLVVLDYLIYLLVDSTNCHVIYIYFKCFTNNNN